MQDHAPHSPRLPPCSDDIRAKLLELKTLRNLELEHQAETQLAANWQQHYEKLDRPRQAWADLIAREPWHWFVTLTFKPDMAGPRGGIHPERADKAFRLLVSSINRSISGPRWHLNHKKALIWARGQEFHKDGRIHFHALFSSGIDDLNLLSRRLSWMDWWHERFGIARIERPTSQGDVCGYVSKYVAKDGEVDVSPNFQKVAGIVECYDRPPQQRKLIALTQ